MKPNFFIVGAPKCGTTAWYEYLRQHPAIFLPQQKEVNYFSADFSNFGTIKTRDEYDAIFSDSAGYSARGEASVMYLYSIIAASNIREYNPNAKILIFLRKQEDYLPSLHNQLLFNGIECISQFDRAWDLAGKRNSSNSPRRCRDLKFLDYKSLGRFHEQVERYFRVFPEDQIRVFHFDDWIHAPRSTYREIMRFLEIGDDQRDDFPVVNTASHHRSQLLGSFTEVPPAWALRLSSLSKKLTGRDRPPFINSLRALNRRKGYGSIGPSESVRKEIGAYFARDNASVNSRIWRPTLPA